MIKNKTYEKSRMSNRKDKKMEKWFLHTKRADFDGISKRFQISPVLARIIRNRGVENDGQMERYLNGKVDALYDPAMLKDMEKATDILLKKLEEGRRIRIIGDYDIDGVCSTYILYRGFQSLGGNVDYEIPDRIKDGYGINCQIIEQAFSDGVDTLVTCDNGISAIEPVRFAKKLGMTVVVTDHHDVPLVEEKEVLVEADAVINPKQESCSYPFDGICGAVVAYKLIENLWREKGLPKEEVLALLECAAIATVGDVMDLIDENRIIVRYGLNLLRRTDNPGLKALMKQTEINPETISSYHIGFIIGPCLNAGGRLDTAKLALKLLLSEDREAAEKIAAELKSLNDMRKTMTQQGVERALGIVEERAMERDKVLVIVLEDCHESLAGIIAGRIREKFEKPTIILTRTEEGMKGSGRSIESYHMFRSLSECRELLKKFGGHPMAAGLSLDEDKVDELRLRLNQNAALTEEDFVKKIWIDVPMPFEYISEAFIEELSLLEPFGKGNPKPVFAQKNLRIRKAMLLGKNKNVLKMTLITEHGNAMESIMFRNGEEFLTLLEEKYGMEVREKLLRGLPNDVVFSAVYYPSVNEYNGNKTLQVIIESYTL